MLRKLGQSYQVSLPKKIVKMLALHVNDYLEIRVEGYKIILEPQVMIPKDQLYFYTPEWQKDEQNAHRDIQKGRVTRTKNLEQLFHELDR